MIKSKHFKIAGEIIAKSVLKEKNKQNERNCFGKIVYLRGVDSTNNW